MSEVTGSYFRHPDSVKFFMLYVLAYLGDAYAPEDILQAGMIDDNLGYIDLSGALEDLMATGHVAAAEGRCYITEKGRDVIQNWEQSLPLSVRRGAQAAAIRARARLRRESDIRCETIEQGTNLCQRLILSDGRDDLMRLELLVVDRQQAKMLEKQFKTNAEAVYNGIIELLLNGGDG